ncbi:MAG TPA: 16S rRNA (cytosine(1402)-N(4))-methyltransferase RsmH [Candidatus Eisenbacteria bacterium]|nr:16S rRNA (cytosine(1402)-N(4))-methyltransferase RsmH [Candidatus Eisenbacteria bacterium]
MPGHVPVLADEAVRLLVTEPRGTYVDATLGGGGHAAKILAALGGEESKVIGIDCDPAAVARAQANPPAAVPRFVAAQGRFSTLEATLEAQGIERVDGILADLGLSSDQLDDPARGLAFAAEGPLDMRLDPSRSETADRLIRRIGEPELARLLSEYGELPRAKTAARVIRRAAGTERPLTTGGLSTALAPLYPGPSRPRRLAQAFQALRIAVNDELGELQALLEAAARIVRPGGALVVIAYHSLEDRMVKRAFSPARPFDPWLPPSEAPASPWEPLTRRPIRPSAEESARNPRARSALLRAARRRGGME